MTGISSRVEEDELMAYVDSRLSPERADAVRAYLATDPEMRQRVSQYAEQRRVLRAAFGAPAGEPIPARLRPAALVAQRRRRRYRQFANIAAAVCLVLLSGLGGWTARDLLAPPIALHPATLAQTIIADAIAAHRIFAVEDRHPVEVDAGRQAQLAQWLSNRLGRPLVIPDLAAAGFGLMGGRLLPSENGPAAQLMYQNGAGSRLTVYLRAGITGEAKFYHNDKGLGAFYWSDDGLGCVIVGVDRSSLRQIAATVYQQTFPDAPKDEFSSEPEKTGAIPLPDEVAAS